MKKFLALLLAVTLLLSMAACGKKISDSEKPSWSSTSPTETESPVSESTGEATGETTGEAVTQGTTAPEETTVPESPAATTPAEPTQPAQPTQPTQPVQPMQPTQPTQPAPAPHAHSYNSSITKKATCTQPGINTFTCACGAAYTSDIPATGHSWGEWTTTLEPTPTAAGNRQRKCSSCSATEDRSIPMLPATVTQAQLQQIHDIFLTLVNAERVRVGVSPLSSNSLLTGWAQIRSEETLELFSHTRPDGQPWHTVIDGNLYPWVTLGENLCMTSHVGNGSYTSADRWVGSQAQIEAAAGWLFTLLKNSSGHYANMINESFTECGVGISCEMYGSSNIPMFYLAHIFGAR